MKRVKRFWFKALEFGVDDALVNLLLKLGAFNVEVWRHYQNESHIALIKYREAKEAKKFKLKQSSKDFNVRKVPPRHIRPTKTR